MKELQEKIQEKEKEIRKRPNEKERWTELKILQEQ